MSVLGRLLPLCFAALLICGCSVVGGKSSEEKVDEAKAKVDWSYAKDGIWIDLAADIDLNFYYNQPHTVVLGIWQFEQEKAYFKLLDDPAALSKALGTGNLPKDVLQLDRYVIQPDTRIVLKVDRAQGAKYVGLLAGYYVFEPERVARYFRIPLNVQSSGLISKDYTAQPAVLALRLLLGSQRIANAQSLTYDADKKVPLEMIPLNNDDLEITVSPDVLKQVAKDSDAAIKLGQ